MRVTVVDPSTPDVGVVAPLGVLYVSAALEEAGHKVNVILRSLSQSWDTIGEKVAAQSPDVVGVACVQSVNIERAAQTVHSIREHCDAPIMMGGIHPTMKYTEVFQMCPVDVIVLQEGELTAVDIVDAVEHQTSFSYIPGILYRNKKNKIIKTEERPLLENLDRLPFPARHLVPLEKFESDSRGNMITSRGCPYACKFCCVSHMHGTKFRARSPENVVAEMRELVSTYDVHYSKFIDDTFSYSRNRVKNICDLLIAHNVDISWGCNTRADKVDYPLLKKMKKAKCVDIYFGIESVNQRTLNAMGKGQTIEQVEKAIILTQKLGIKVTGSIIIGLPYETKHDVLKTLKFVEELQLDRVGIQILAPHPGSDIYDNLEKYGITLLNDDYTLQNQFNPIIETSELSKDDIIDLTLTALEIGASRGSVIL